MHDCFFAIETLTVNSRDVDFVAEMKENSAFSSHYPLCKSCQIPLTSHHDNLRPRGWNVWLHTTAYNAIWVFLLVYKVTKQTK